MHLWFEYLWEERCNEKGQVKCFECNRIMNRNTYKNNIICYSHILPKGINKYKFLAGEESNLAIVHPECHHLYELNPKKASNQYKKRLELLKKHDL